MPDAFADAQRSPRTSIDAVTVKTRSAAAVACRRSTATAGFAALVLAGAPSFSSAQSSAISVKNQCSFSIWIQQTPNGGYSVLPGSNTNPAGRLDPSQSTVFTIPAGGWGGRLWPKTGCDANGNNCEAGSSVSGCPSNGCEPPADTKVEFFFDPLSSGKRPYYDISLVDGYTLPAKITPSKSDGGRCTATDCAVALSACPTNEADVGDLRIIKGGKTVQCLAPCKKWNYPPPYGMNRNEKEPPGEFLCCPTPPVSPGECRRGIIEKTKYVSLVRAECPSAYSYSYDDLGGSHDCPSGTSFAVVFCP